MYDVNEVSKLIGLSKVTIYKKIKKLSELKEYVVIKDDKTYILEDGLNILKNSIYVNNKIKDEIASDDESYYIRTNKEFIKVLTDQLKEKDIQLREKDIQIQELINLNKNNQILLKQNNDRDILQLEGHFKEIDNKLINLREKMDQKKEQKKLKKNYLSKLWSK